MKKILYYLVIGIFVASSTSCEKYLDINDNPNSATSSSAALVLPQAITGSATVVSSYNNYGGNIGGYISNAGGFAGFGSLLTYSYTSLDYQGLWSASYDNLNDFEYVFQSTKGSEADLYYNASARIMKVYIFQKLVDTYNDIPYTNSLKGNKVISPNYDKAEDVYKDLVAQCDSAIQTITRGQAAAIAPNSLKSSVDPLFKGNMNSWMKFANTLKLKLLVKMNGIAATQAFADSKFPTINTSIGFLTDDAIVNPGYAKAAGRQNPQWETYAYPNSGTTVQGSGRSRIPSKFILSFYNGLKLDDSGRGSEIFRSFPTTASNQLGYEESDAAFAPTGFPAWYTAGNAGDDALGVLKGASMGQPLILAAESYFLQSEANLLGKLAGNAAANFNAGITASFTYTYKTVNNIVASGYSASSDVAAYIVNNPTYLADYTLATTNAQRLEAIITQKYIAMNFIHGDEAYNEFRRTSFPAIVNGSSSATATFASLKSVSTRADKLPSRILYPNTEFQYNPGNVPSGIEPFKSKIFWDLN